MTSVLVVLYSVLGQIYFPCRIASAGHKGLNIEGGSDSGGNDTISPHCPVAGAGCPHCPGWNCCWCRHFVLLSPISHTISLNWAAGGAQLQTGHLNIRDIWYWACKWGTVWWDQIGMSFAGLLGVRKCDAHPIWWKHFVSNQNVMEATPRWCYHQSWAVNIKFPNKSFILAASSRADNKISRSFTGPLKSQTVLVQLSIY